MPEKIKSPVREKVALRKQFSCQVEMKSGTGENDPGGLKVVASTEGTIDRGGDVIAVGAYKDAVLTSFVDNGSILIGHDWSSLPVGYAISADMSGGKLVSEATFHSTESGQEARTVCAERLAAGKSVSVSVGFMPDYDNGGCIFFRSGQDMLNWLVETGGGTAGYDTTSIALWDDYCWLLLRVIELFEWSICIVGMNQFAQAMEAKSHRGGVAKSQANTVSGILQAKIHQSFTVAADELAIRGYMNVEERIALSGCIGNVLKQFAVEIDPAVANRSVESADVDAIATKSETQISTPAEAEEPEPDSPDDDPVLANSESEAAAKHAGLALRTLNLRTAASQRG